MKKSLFSSRKIQIQWMCFSPSQYFLIPFPSTRSIPQPRLNPHPAFAHHSNPYAATSPYKVNRSSSAPPTLPLLLLHPSTPQHLLPHHPRAFFPISSILPRHGHRLRRWDIASPVDHLNIRKRRGHVVEGVFVTGACGGRVCDDSDDELILPVRVLASAWAWRQSSELEKERQCTNRGANRKVTNLTDFPKNKSCDCDIAFLKLQKSEQVTQLGDF